MFIISLSRWLGSLTLEQLVIHKGGRVFVHVTAQQTILIVMMQIPLREDKEDRQCIWNISKNAIHTFWNGYGVPGCGRGTLWLNISGDRRSRLGK